MITLSSLKRSSHAFDIIINYLEASGLTSISEEDISEIISTHKDICENKSRIQVMFRHEDDFRFINENIKNNNWAMPVTDVTKCGFFFDNTIPYVSIIHGNNWIGSVGDVDIKSQDFKSVKMTTVVALSGLLRKIIEDASTDENPF